MSLLGNTELWQFRIWPRHPTRWQRQPSDSDDHSSRNDAQAWEDMIRKCLDEIAAEAWAASGSLVKDGKRWIPSVVLVQKYWTHASARFGSYEQIVDGETYLIGDRTHIRWGLDQWSPTENPGAVGRTWWSTLNHEYAHNFLEFGDLYGPQGCTGYRDLLGDNSPPGRMSEVSSIFKHQVGWLDFKGVIEGPTVASSRLSLQPYTSTGEAYKVVPDRAHTPHEYFLLEFRGSLGNEVWRPDGGLPESGLLITHINERLGVAGTWLLREAPFFIPNSQTIPAAATSIGLVTTTSQTNSSQWEPQQLHEVDDAD